MKINLLDYLHETVSIVPERTAVIDGNRSIAFRDLTEKSKMLSRVVSQRTDYTIRKPVAVFMKKNIGCIVSDIAIIYSGNAYMNLDVKTPLARIQAILELINPALIITDSNYAEALASIWPNEKMICFDSLSWNVLQYEQVEINSVLDRIIDTDPLCIINTSGSTGVPKGVVLNHRSFIDFMEWAKETAKIKDDEVIGSLSPIVFDIYSFELCMLMSNGSTMVLLEESLATFPVRILQILASQRVTFIFWVPTIMVNIANLGLLEKIPLPDLKTVWFAGEVFQTKHFNIWRKNLPGVKFINLYGPIEITLDCTYFIIERNLADDEPIPIGYACKNTDILILNENNQLCKTYEEGELCVRGGSLAMGYYNDPQKTATVFVQNPLNTSYPEIIYRTGDIALVNDCGEIIFKGRKDTLIKHSGYRIELSEIEHVVVNKLKLVHNGCAVYDNDKKEIVFFYESDNDVTVPFLRKHIGEELPKYMIPTKYIQMEALPRNTNGKIDRLKLKEQINEQI